MTAPPSSLRLMTYNVHRCIGNDGHQSVDRIVRVIRSARPDVVALQELDVLPGPDADQVRAVATRLGMRADFAAAVVSPHRRYGNALLSRYPMTLIRADHIVPPPTKPRHEPRSALLASMDTARGKLGILATHLSRNRKERRAQVRALLGPDWLGRLSGSRVLCGDLNCTPGSRSYRTLRRELKDVGRSRVRPRGTWHARWPLLRIDHVFAEPTAEIQGAEIVHSRLSRLASDHLPLVVSMRV